MFSPKSEIHPACWVCSFCASDAKPLALHNESASDWKRLMLVLGPLVIKRLFFPWPWIRASRERRRSTRCSHATLKEGFDSCHPSHTPHVERWKPTIMNKNRKIRALANFFINFNYNYALLFCFMMNIYVLKGKHDFTLKFVMNCNLGSTDEF